MDNQAEMNEIDEKTKQVIVGVLNAMPDKDIFESFETHARRRAFVVSKFIARYNDLVYAIASAYTILPPEISSKIAEKASRFTDSLEELGECMEDAGKDVLTIGESQCKVLEELQKAL